MRKDLVLFYTITALFWFSLYIYVPFVSPFSEDLGASMRLIGMIGGAYGFTQMLVRFPLGILSDKLQKRRVFVMLGLFFTAVSGFVVFFFPTPGALLASRAFGGVAASAWVLFMIMGAAYHGGEQASKSVGYLNSANHFGRLWALFLGGIVAERFGVPYAFLMAGIVGIVGMLLCGGLKEVEVQKKPPTLDDLLQAIKNRQLIAVAILGIMVQYLTFATTFGFTPLVATYLGASNYQLGLLGMIATIPGMFLSPIAGTLLPKWFGIKGTLAGSFVIMAAVAALTPLCQSLWQLFAIQVVGAGGSAAAFTLLMGLSIQDMPQERRATAMGFFQAMYGFGMFMGPFSMGLLGDGLGLNMGFVVIGGLGVLSAVLSVLFVRMGYIRG